MLGCPETLCRLSRPWSEANQRKPAKRQIFFSINSPRLILISFQSQNRFYESVCHSEPCWGSWGAHTGLWIPYTDVQAAGIMVHSMKEILRKRGFGVRNQRYIHIFIDFSHVFFKMFPATISRMDISTTIVISHAYISQTWNSKSIVLRQREIWRNRLPDHDSRAVNGTVRCSPTDQT